MVLPEHKSFVAPTEKIEAIPDFNFAKLTREQSAEKMQTLQELYDRNFGSISGKDKVEFKAGYIFFPELNQRIIKDEDFRDLYEKVAKPHHFQFPDRYKTEIENAKDILSQEYKIHLMPKSEFTPFILEQLFKAIKNDPELASSISQIKVIADDKKKREEIMPQVVIYTQLGKANAQLALDKIYQHLGRYRDVGTGETPRYNRKVDELIYYAQSGGDWKNDYLNGAKAVGRDIAKDEVFDSDLIHFNGDYKLNIPKEVKAVEGPPVKEVPKTPEHIAFDMLLPGDVINIVTQSSQYRFEIYVDPVSGKRGIKNIDSKGKLAGTSGLLAINSLKVGGQLRYEGGQTSKIVDFDVQRSPTRTIRGLEDLNEREKEAIRRLREHFKH